MTRPKESGRVRACKPKTKSGCRTCKIRRVKCDEGRPVCQKCLSVNRICDGYELPASTRPDSHSSRVILLPQVQWFVGLSSSEVQNFGFFREQTAREIPGCFKTHLWDRIILQISHHEPSVLHAAIAVASMHQSYKEKDNSDHSIIDIQDQRQTFALKQYNKSINYVRKLLAAPTDTHTTETVLITCLLFFYLETLQGDLVTASQHLRIGLKIISEQSSITTLCPITNRTLVTLQPIPATTLDFLISTFSRLDCESTLSGELEPQLSISTMHSSDGKPRLSIPHSFSSLMEARQHLDFLNCAILQLKGFLLKQQSEESNDNHRTDWAVALVTRHAKTRKYYLDNHDSLCPEVKRLQSGLAHWEKSFEAWIEKSPKDSRTNDEARAITLLKARCFYMLISIVIYQDTTEMGCDTFEDNFRTLLALVTQYVNESGNNTQDGTAPNLAAFPPMMTLESMVLPSIYIIAVKCRTPDIRIQAASLLGRFSYNEGGWDCKLLSKVAFQIIKVEQEAAGKDNIIKAEDVPSPARISDVLVALTETPGHARLVCARYRNEIDGELYVWEVPFEL